MTNLATSYKPASVVSNSFTLGAVLTSAAIVIGPPVGTLYGYSSTASLGSLSPDTFNGQTIVAIVSASLAGTSVSISGVQTIDFFTSVTINGTTLNTADSINFNPGVTTVWNWTSQVLVGVIGAVPVGFS